MRVRMPIQPQLNFISGLADCHLPGLYSLVISDRQSPEIGMRRVFYCGPTCDMGFWEGADFRLKPHNHRQSIRLTLLFGKAENRVFDIGPRGTLRVWCYKFGSALLGGSFALERTYYDNASYRIQPLAEKPIDLHWAVVHTVTAERDSAWLVEEFETAPHGAERCFSVSDHLELDSSGLYKPIGDPELADLSEYIHFRSGGRI